MMYINLFILIPNFNLSIVNCQLSIVNCELSIINILCSECRDLERSKVDCKERDKTRFCPV